MSGIKLSSEIRSALVLERSAALNPVISRISSGVKLIKVFNASVASSPRALIALVSSIESMKVSTGSFVKFSRLPPVSV